MLPLAAATTAFGGAFVSFGATCISHTFELEICSTLLKVATKNKTFFFV